MSSWPDVHTVPCMEFSPGKTGPKSNQKAVVTTITFLPLMYHEHILLDQLLITLQPFQGSGPFEILEELYIVVPEKWMCLYAKVS